MMDHQGGKYVLHSIRWAKESAFRVELSICSDDLILKLHTSILRAQIFRRYVRVTPVRAEFVQNQDMF